MNLQGKKILITGGCGFIGSYLVDALYERGGEITVVDNLSNGTTEYIDKYLRTKDPKVSLIIGDIRDFKLIKRLTKGKDIVFHFAAQPDVRLSTEQAIEDFEVNVTATVYILEGMRLNGIRMIVFASSAGTIYGDKPVMPTPEEHPFYPISHYGASKAACEMYLLSFSHLFGITSISLRYGNIFGPRSTHGVVYDFFYKLRKNPHHLEILGDGKQEKSYLYIDDCIRATLLCTKKAPAKRFSAYNISSSETMKVRDIARIVVQEMGLKKVKFNYTGGKRGWPGDVIKTKASLQKLEKLGFKPKVKIEEGIRRYVRWLRER